VVRLPTALPSIFAGMKISVTFAAVEAIIGEFAAGTAGCVTSSGCLPETWPCHSDSPRSPQRRSSALLGTLAWKAWNGAYSVYI
jgi:hypothetical protein